MVPYLIEVAPSLTGSRKGLECVLECVSNGSAKQRKNISRLLKPDIVDFCNHIYGHLLVVRLLDCTDDTVMLRKELLSPMLPALLAVASDSYGSKVLFSLLSPRSTKVFGPSDMKFLTDSSTLQSDEAVKVSKKDSGIRQQELLNVVKKEMIKMCVENAGQLLCSQHGCLVIEEAAKVWWKEPELLDAIAKASIEECIQKGQEEETAVDMCPMRNLYGHVSLRRLLNSKEEHSQDFAKKLLNELKQEPQKLQTLSTIGPSAYVLAALAQSSPTAKKSLAAAINFKKKKATNEETKSGVDVLRKNLV